MIKILKFLCMLILEFCFIFMFVNIILQYVLEKIQPDNFTVMIMVLLAISIENWDNKKDE